MGREREGQRSRPFPWARRFCGEQFTVRLNENIDCAPRWSGFENRFRSV
jgi:hypothetical protein